MSCRAAIQAKVPMFKHYQSHANVIRNTSNISFGWGVRSPAPQQVGLKPTSRSICDA
jgi:hypothetical protein